MCGSEREWSPEGDPRHAEINFNICLKINLK